MGTDEHNSVRLPERRAEKDLSADSPMPEMEEIVVMVKRSQKLDTDSRCFFVCWMRVPAPRKPSGGI